MHTNTIYSSHVVNFEDKSISGYLSVTVKDLTEQSHLYFKENMWSTDLQFSQDWFTVSCEVAERQ